jgi:hypothetical protein
MTSNRMRKSENVVDFEAEAEDERLFDRGDERRYGLPSSCCAFCVLRFERFRK